MKLGPVTKLDKRNKIMSKNLTMTLCQQIVTSLLLLQFMASLELCGSQILDASSVKRTFPLIVTFYSKKTESRTKKSLHRFHTIVLKKCTIFAKNAIFLKKKC